ncbi:MAG: sensor histidine kinase, partial [Bacteroidota bacterium]
RWGLAINYTDVANIYREKENRDSSKIYLKKAYIIQKEENLESDLMLTLASLTLLDTESNNLDSAQNYLNEAFSLQSDTKKGKREVYRVAYILNRKKGNTKKALEYHELFVTTKDSILNDVTQKNLNETLAKYETEKKEREIAEQEVIIKQQELDLSNKQRQIAIWGGLGGILILLLGASLWTGKERQKRKEQEIVSIKSQQEVVRLESLVAGEEKERIRLAQDLHDGINGDLSVIKFKIDGVDKKQMSETTTEGLNQAMHMLDNAIDQVRRISHNLAPPSLQNFNLTEAIKQYASKMQSTHGIQIDFQTFGKMPSFTSDQETALYRIVQELLNNIIKHAEAKETLIQLNYTDEHTELVIEDDGKGFDTKISKNGIGLQNIASRVAFLKGNLNIESSGEGSTFTITLPKIS